MKIFDRVIVTEVVSVFLFSVAVLVGFVWVGFGPLEAALKYRGMGIPMRLILEIAAFNIVPIFGYALPISMLIAVIVTFVRMSENSEAVAVFASGVSLYRVLLPMAIVAFCITLCGLTINNSVVPYTVERISDFKTNISKEIKPTNEAFWLPAARDGDGHLLATVYVDGGFDQRLNALRRVTINEFDPKTGRPLVTVYADQAKWQGGNNWSLKDVVVLGIGSRNKAVALATQDLKVSRKDLEALEVDPDTLNFFQLARLIARLRDGRVSDVQQYETSLWEKIALPLATFIFAMVAAPIALRPQRGYNRTIAALGGFIIIGAYYILMQILEIVAADRMIDPFIAAFLPDFLGIAVAAYLISRAPT